MQQELQNGVKRNRIYKQLVVEKEGFHVTERRHRSVKDQEGNFELLNKGASQQ